MAVSDRITVMNVRANGSVEPAERGVLVAQVMSGSPLVLQAVMRLEPAVALLVDHGYSGAPVINDCGRLTGMLHAVDVAAMHLGAPDDRAAEPSGPCHLLVGELARRPVTIRPTNTMHTAAVRMRRHRTDRLAVVDEPGHVVGVVSGHDLLRTIVRYGNLLSDLVHTQIAALALPYVSAAVDLSGVVLLTGAVGSYADRTRLVHAIGAIEGVTEVHELLDVVPT
jgi:CBS domain-containing protein